MELGLYLALDDWRDPDVGADFLELVAFFAEDQVVRVSDVANETSIGTDEEPFDQDYELEEIVSLIVERIVARRKALGPAYPFRLDRSGDILTSLPIDDSLEQAAYILSLVLSNLQTILNESPLRPMDSEIRWLRQRFQYMSTAALAAEIQGTAWSFGYPRPDRSTFLGKLREIWSHFDDGMVKRQPGAPERPKDDKVDVFAARVHPDRLPGFLLAAAQVATGSDWRDKSLLGHGRAFKDSWFSPTPVTRFIPYMIVPFAVDDTGFRRDVSTLGNLLHRLRVPVRVAEAGKLWDAGVKIEAYDRLQAVVDWVASYRDRPREAA